MPRISGEGRGERAKSLAAVAAIHAALGYAFLTGLTPKLVETVEASLKLFEISESPPPPPIVEIVPPPPKESKSAPEGEASPPNIKSVASPVVAPPPEVKIEVPPPPIVAAPLPAQGSDRTTGAAEIPGPGTGAGGVGNGTGAGGRGTGTGAGGTGDGTGAGPGGVAVGARLVRGRLRNSDYPRSAARAKAGGTVMVSYEVGPDGRVHDCRIMKSSGNDDLDGITCHLIQKRFRYAPARDFEGRPVSDKVGWRQDWWLER